MEGRQSPVPPEINVFGVWFKFGLMVDPTGNDLGLRWRIGSKIRYTRIPTRVTSRSEGEPGKIYERRLHQFICVVRGNPW